MIIRFRKVHIKSIKKNPLIDKLKAKQENTLRNCRIKAEICCNYSKEIN